VALIETLFQALNRHEVRYVVVGGLAVVLHGHARLTADVDLVVDLDPNEAGKAIAALQSLGLRARAPVDPTAFADAEARAAWVRDKGMRVFSMWDPANPMREVDLFVEHPIPFAGLWERSAIVPLESTSVRVASIDDLIALKRLAGRDVDKLDIQALEEIQKNKKGNES
jgi:hypothetical protein